MRHPTKRALTYLLQLHNFLISVLFHRIISRAFLGCVRKIVITLIANYIPWHKMQKGRAVSSFRPFGNVWISQSTALREKLTGPQLKIFLTFYKTRRFITAFTRPRQLSLSFARSIQSIATSRILKIHFNIILLSTARSSSCSLRFAHQNPVWTSPLPQTCYVLCSLILPYLITRNISDEEQRS
jgi:hypothetical protein